jgi:hypothetical protein
MEMARRFIITAAVPPASTPQWFNDPGCLGAGKVSLLSQPRRSLLAVQRCRD